MVVVERELAGTFMVVMRKDYLEGILMERMIITIFQAYFVTLLPSGNARMVANALISGEDVTVIRIAPMSRMKTKMFAPIGLAMRTGNFSVAIKRNA